MTASQFIRRPASVPPFSGKGGIRSMERGPCFAFNRGEMCEKKLLSLCAQMLRMWGQQSPGYPLLPSTGTTPPDC